MDEQKQRERSTADYANYKPDGAKRADSPDKKYDPEKDRQWGKLLKYIIVLLAAAAVAGGAVAFFVMKRRAARNRRPAINPDQRVTPWATQVENARRKALAELPAMVDAGVPTAKAFMVFDFRLADRSIFEAMRVLGGRGGMLEVHCEDPVLIDAAVASALQHGDTSPRHHAATRTTEAEAVATHRAMAFARAADAPVHVVHLSCADALAFVAEARAGGVRATAETCPHYLTLTDARYDEPDPLECAKCVISPPLRPAADGDALWSALAAGDLSLVATDHVPDRMAVEKGEAARGVSFERISNGAPGIETLLSVVYGQGVATGRITVERMVDLLATTPARRFGLARKGAIEAGRDADLVLFDPAARRTIRAVELHHTSDFTPYEGMEVRGAVRSVVVRGRPVIQDGRAVGERGYGRFVERGEAGG